MEWEMHLDNKRRIFYSFAANLKITKNYHTVYVKFPKINYKKYITNSLLVPEDIY